MGNLSRFFIDRPIFAGVLVYALRPGSRRKFEDLERSLKMLFAKIGRAQGVHVEFSMRFDEAMEVRG